MFGPDLQLYLIRGNFEKTAGFQGTVRCEM